MSNGEKCKLIWGVEFAAFWRCARRNRATRRVHVAARRTTNSTSWRKCCLFRRPSRHSWIRHPSSGWPSPSSGLKTSPATESRRGSKRIPPNPSKVSLSYSEQLLEFMMWFQWISHLPWRVVCRRLFHVANSMSKVARDQLKMLNECRWRMNQANCNRHEMKWNEMKRNETKVASVTTLVNHTHWLR